MKKKYFGLALLSLIFLISACHDKPQRNVKGVEASEQTDTKDSTIYGVCGDGTMMHSLQLISRKLYRNADKHYSYGDSTLACCLKHREKHR